MVDYAHDWSKRALFLGGWKPAQWGKVLWNCLRRERVNRRNDINFLCSVQKSHSCPPDGTAIVVFRNRRHHQRYSMWLRWRNHRESRAFRWTSRVPYRARYDFIVHVRLWCTVTWCYSKVYPKSEFFEKLFDVALNLPAPSTSLCRVQNLAMTTNSIP